MIKRLYKLFDSAILSTYKQANNSLFISLTLFDKKADIMKASKQRKLARAIVSNKGLQNREAVRITDAQLKLRDDEWAERDFQFWIGLIRHYQPIKR